MKTASKKDDNDLAHDIFPRCGAVALVIVFSLIVLTAILLTLFTIKNSAIYGDKCLNGLCRSDLGLVCLNESCACSNDYFHHYDGCQTKRLYLERCHNISAPCAESINLYCIDGVCKCDNMSFWNKQYCESKRTYNETCKSRNSIECQTSQLLECNGVKCSCGYKRY